jgi:hypothetical protein
MALHKLLLLPLLLLLLLSLSSADVHFFAATMNHGGGNSAINIQMSAAGNCDVLSFGGFDSTVHQNCVWDTSKQVLHGYDGGQGVSPPALSTWATNGTDVGTVPLTKQGSAFSPAGLYMDNSGDEPGSLFALSLSPPTLSQIDSITGVVDLLVSIPDPGYSWIVPSGAFDPKAGVVYQVATTQINASSMALTLLAATTRPPFSYGATPLTAADPTISSLVATNGIWGLTVALTGKRSLVGVLQTSNESNMLVSVDPLTGAVSRLGVKGNEFSGASLMDSILSVDGMLYVDTLDSSETTNRLHAFNASTGTLLATCVLPHVYNMDNFVAFR